jgi:2,4-dienoyl-CoA reductase-like NADH-dependent reductase (Old Yellow Enzyme family)
VELHYAHAYTMASFLSPLNQRDDGYGGSRANRVKLPLEVYRAVRASVSQRFVVGCRFLTEECIPGGYTAEDAAWFGAEFGRAGVDYLSLSRGGKFEDAKQPRVGWARYPYTGPSGYECMPTVRSDERGPFGRNRAAVRAVREAVRAAGCSTPVVLSGGISTFEQAEELLQSGVADIIASARQSLADPDWFRKLRLGLGAEVRRCVFTNYCEGLDQVHKPVTCKLWDHIDGHRRMIAPAWEPATR